MWVSITNTKISSYINMFGEYDYNVTPMALPGNKLATYKKKRIKSLMGTSRQ